MVSHGENSKKAKTRKGKLKMKKLGITFATILLMLGCFALLPAAQAQLPPPAPDGGYPNFNTAEGDFALSSITTGADNTAVGNSALTSNTTGDANTAVGSSALVFNTTGFANIATGTFALFFNTTGSQNTATGGDALQHNTTGVINTATGIEALFRNTTGSFNTAIGGGALLSNTTGNDNTALGFRALRDAQSVQNTAVGSQALQHDTSGYNNAANGFGALNQNTTGFENTAMGAGALGSNTTGGDNTATGLDALVFNTTGSNNMANGVNALEHNSTGSNNIALGSNAGQNLTTGSNNIEIGDAGVAAEANTIRIGTQGTQTATYVAGIMGKTVPMSTPVFVNASGKLGTTTSSARFKDEIKPMETLSEAILALKPVSFRYKKEIDPDRTPQFGLVAEQVEKVNPDLVVRDADGKPYTVRYEAVNAMLLNEFLKEHRTVLELKKEITALTATVKEQASRIQKVSAQVEMSRLAAQVALNNP
jgi:trimeric autotransporter adhesin